MRPGRLSEAGTGVVGKGLPWLSAQQEVRTSPGQRKGLCGQGLGQTSAVTVPVAFSLKQ